MPTTRGKVYLVGGGPGDPGLITLRGAECLRRAEVVLYDYLVNPHVLAHAHADATLICLGRHGRDRILSQDEINAETVRHALAGKTVVRLKGGDPIVFARITEEIAALEAADVSYEIVPGITAALAVGSYAGIPLTQGESASAVALVTGHEREGKETALDYGALAAFPGTLVFYMGMTTAEHWTMALIAAGKPADTPAAIVRRVSHPDQQTVLCTLGTIVAEIQSRRLRPPALVIVGAVAETAHRHDWFVERPLFGKKIIVTRPAHQAPELVTTLGGLGAEVLVQPAIEIGTFDDWQPVDRMLERLDEFDWLVFSSSNGVRGFLDRLLQSRDLRAVGHLKFAAIGPATAEELLRYRLRADVIPGVYRAEALADSLASEAKLGKRFLLARASRGREVLADDLTGQGGHVEQVVVYASRDIQTPDEEIVRLLEAGKIDWITVTSSAIAGALAVLLGDRLRKARLASISPLTSNALRTLGFEVAAEAKVYTMAGLVTAICDAEQR